MPLKEGQKYRTKSSDIAYVCHNDPFGFSHGMIIKPDIEKPHFRSFTWKTETGRKADVKSRSMYDIVAPYA